jgi:DNA-binding response OmpR family regulator
MLYSDFAMPVVFVIARDWTLRTSLRAELIEHGIEALGMENADDAGRSVASGQLPAVVVLEATAGVADSLALQKLIQSVPAVLIASRTEFIPLPPAAAVFYRPIRIGEIVARVRELLRRGHAA